MNNHPPRRHCLVGGNPDNDGVNCEDSGDDDDIDQVDEDDDNDDNDDDGGSV